MNKSLLALALLGAFAGAASAQSSVTLSGTLDLNLQAVSNTGSARRLSMGQDGINSSQLVFAGREDLGDGMYTGFMLNAGTLPETGTMNAKFFNRGSYVDLGGRFGEVRLGRDYVPTFYAYTLFDVFGANGVGHTAQNAQIGASALGEAGNKLIGKAASGYAYAYGTTMLRADNMVSYMLPRNLGGVYGQVSVAAGEGGANNPGRYVGGRVGFAAGPFNIVAAYGQQGMGALAAVKAGTSMDIGNVAASYDLGVVKLMGYYDEQKLDLASGANLKEKRESLGAAIPVGVGEIHLGYGRSKLTNSLLNASNTISNEGVGYVYNISKRTAVYATYGHLSNGIYSINSLAVGGMETAAPTYGGSSTGYGFGLRHFF